jgi:germination protein YpeB
VQIAKDFWLGENAAGFQGRVAYESVGDAPAYSVELDLIQNGAAIPFAEVDVAKADGRVLWAMAIPDASLTETGDPGLMNPPASSAERLAQGGRRALDFLAQRNFPDMALAYSQEEGGYGVYTLTPLQEGVRLYADQVKVQADLGEMKIIGYEGTPFYHNHRQRVLQDIVVTRQKLLTFISPYLRVEEINLALIQDDWGKEILTWEVRAALDQEHFSLYYNCVTGAEEKILRL